MRKLNFLLNYLTLCMTYLFTYMLIRYVRSVPYFIPIINFRDEGWRLDSIDKYRLFYPTYYRVTNNYQVDNFLHFVERLVKQYLWQVPVFCIFWPARKPTKKVSKTINDTACNNSDVSMSDMDDRSNFDYQNEKGRESPASSIWSKAGRL